MATSSQDELLALRGRDPAAFVDEATARLAAAGTPDPVLALELARVYHAHGLGEATVEAVSLIDAALVAGVPLPPGVDPEPLRREAEALPPGRLEWRMFARTFDENLAALAVHHPEAAAARRAHVMHGVRDEWQLHRDRSGAIRASRREGPCRVRRWLGGFRAAEGVDGLEIPREDGRPYVPLVLGLDASRLVDRVWATTATERGQGHTPVNVVEPSLASAGLWLHLVDRRELLRDPRVHLFLGEDACADYESFLRERPMQPPHAVVLSVGPTHALSSWAETLRNRLAAERAARAVAARARLAQRCDARRPADWADRLERPDGATIVGFTSRHTTMLQHSMRDIGAGLESLGHRFHLLIEPDDEARFLPDVLLERVTALEPDLVILINHLRPRGLDVFGTIPLLTWVQDPVEEVLSRAGAAACGPTDFCAGFYAERAVKELGYPEDHYVPVGFFPVSPQVFHDAPLPDAAARARFECDVAYVGHFHGTPEAFLARVARDYPEAARPLLPRLRTATAAAVAASPSGILTAEVARAIVGREAARVGLAPNETLTENLANFVVLRVADIERRLESLEWTARWAEETGRRFHLYGHGWADHAPLRRWAQGPVGHGEEARQAYRGATLSLQLLPTGMTHQRTFEALLAGSLVVARRSPVDFTDRTDDEVAAMLARGEMPDHVLYRAGFRDLHDIVFTDEASLRATLDRWLGDDDARHARRSALAEATAGFFTYDAVIPEILAKVCAGLRAADA